MSGYASTVGKGVETGIQEIYVMALIAIFRRAVSAV